MAHEKEMSAEQTYFGLNLAELQKRGIFALLGIDSALDTAAQKIAFIHTLQRYINDKLIDQGVLLLHSESTFIDFDVKIAAGTTVHQNNIISGKTIIGRDCTLFPGNVISDCTLGACIVVRASTLDGASFGDGTTVGPNAYVRPGTRVGQHCRIGDFVELKNAVIGDDTKVSHLTYVGDAELGKHVNLGCGVVFVNYNGKEKRKTTVGDNAFIGCNCNLIAPVSVGKGAYIAAGATVTKDLPDDAFCIARSRETVYEGRATKYLKK